MLRSHDLILVFLLMTVACLVGGAAEAADWELVWSDEFDGSSLDLTKWEPQIGTGCPNLCGWGNQELQYYRAENATVAGGMLTIEARQEYYAGRNYTSARLRTLNKGDFTYGRIEMRATLPKGQGLWPAFWMLPTDQVYGGWASSGEIDIMELKGRLPATIGGTIHYGDGFPDNVWSNHETTLQSGDFSEDFHVFAVEWEPTELRWYMDDELYGTQTNWYSAGQPFPAPFDERFHILLNVAVGGTFDGDPDGTTVFPQQMVVDYVRVYRDTKTCEIEYDGMDHANPFGNGWFQFNGAVGGGGISGNTTDLPPVEGGTASLNSGWGSSGPGFVGGFGRSRDLDLTGFTHFEFWINPDAGQEYILELNLQDDDNGDGSISVGPDDEFQYELSVGGPGSEVVSGAGWQKVSIPVSDFYDDNGYWNGGNGELDAVQVSDGGNGMLANVVIAIIDQTGGGVNFRTDRWAFTRRASAIGGVVWDDIDGDGVQDPGEPGMPSATVRLLDGASSLVGTTTTSGTGQYEFDELITGSFTVIVDRSTLPGGFVPTYDPDGIGTPDLFGVDLTCDVVSANGDFGFRNPATDAPGSSLLRDRLYNANPNPFNARTEIRFELAQAGPAELSIHDARGRLVRTLESGSRDAGTHVTVWDGTDTTGSVVASGVYYAALETRVSRLTARMVLLK